MLLVVGPPGSGCTTFLKIMANMRQEYHAVNGDVTVGGDDAVNMKEAFPGDFAFAGKIKQNPPKTPYLHPAPKLTTILFFPGEEDVHFASLSVGTTLR